MLISIRVNIRSSSFQYKYLGHVFWKYEFNIASYADDNTLHTYDSDLYAVLSKLKSCADSLFTWFKKNHMKSNGDKCQLVGTNEKSVSINTDGGNVKKK